MEEHSTSFIWNCLLLTISTNVYLNFKSQLYLYFPKKAFFDHLAQFLDYVCSSPFALLYHYFTFTSNQVNLNIIYFSSSFWMGVFYIFVNLRTIFISFFQDHLVWVSSQVVSFTTKPCFITFSIRYAGASLRSGRIFPFCLI